MTKRRPPGMGEPFLKLGSLNKGSEDYITVAKAREIAKTVKSKTKR